MDLTQIAVCDHVYQDATLLTEYLKELDPGVEVDIYTDSGRLAERVVKEECLYDLIFMNIVSGSTEGIESARKIRKKENYTPIIFVSDSGDYYKEAYEVFAYNYLLKPVDKKELQRILHPLRLQGQSREEKVLNFRYRSQTHTLRLIDIVYISSSLHTVNFYLKDGSSVHCRGKLNDFSAQLEDSVFLRCHQSFYVNMAEIISMKTDSFTVKDALIPISRSYAKQVQERYREYLQTIRETGE